MATLSCFINAQQESKIPIVLKTTQEAKDGRDLGFNQHSTVRIDIDFDIDFDYSSTLASSSSTTVPQTNAIKVNLEEVFVLKLIKE